MPTVLHFRHDLDHGPDVNRRSGMYQVEQVVESLSSTTVGYDLFPKPWEYEVRPYCHAGHEDEGCM